MRLLPGVLKIIHSQVFLCQLQGHQGQLGNHSSSPFPGPAVLLVLWSQVCRYTWQREGNVHSGGKPAWIPGLGQGNVHQHLRYSPARAQQVLHTWQQVRHIKLGKWTNLDKFCLYYGNGQERGELISRAWTVSLGLVQSASAGVGCSQTQPIAWVRDMPVPMSVVAITGNAQRSTPQTEAKLLFVPCARWCPGLDHLIQSHSGSILRWVVASNSPTQTR